MFGKLSTSDYVALRLSYSLKDFTFDFEKFCDLLTSKGFDTFAPRRRTAGEIFETITGRLGRTYQQGDIRYKVVVAEATENKSDTIERVILAAAINRQKRTVTDGDKVARLLFDKTTESFQCITTEVHPPWHCSNMNEDLKDCPAFLIDLLGDIPAAMAEEKELASSGQIRSTFQRIISSVGIPVEDIKAAWTIPKEAEDVAFGIKEMGNVINKNLAEKKVRIDLLPIVDDEEIKTELAEDAVVFATQEFEKFLLREQEKIEVADDPDKAQEKAMVRFNKEASKIITLIRKHRATLGDAIEKIEKAEKRFEENLKVFEVEPELERAVS
ncbi:MAG TPA: hypothetical protein HA262_03890 [Methanosarcina sp.]|jgi:hypothetical protein|nr:hypothetical protein [Methanosarcina sp.]